MLHDGKKHMQVAQPQTPADAAFPIDCSGHRFLSIGIEANWAFLLYQPFLGLQSDGMDCDEELGHATTADFGGWVEFCDRLGIF